MLAAEMDGEVCNLPVPGAEGGWGRVRGDWVVAGRHLDSWEVAKTSAFNHYTASQKKK